MDQPWSALSYQDQKRYKTPVCLLSNCCRAIITINSKPLANFEGWRGGGGKSPSWGLPSAPALARPCWSIIDRDINRCKLLLTNTMNHTSTYSICRIESSKFIECRTFNVKRSTFNGFRTFNTTYLYSYTRTYVAVFGRLLESRWHQPTCRWVYAGHLSLKPRAKWVLVWVTVWHRLY